MKRIIVVLALLLLASGHTAFAQNDAKAKAALDGLSKKINGLKSLKANFALHLAGASGKVTDTKKGTFSMKGGKYHIQLAKQEIICDNKTVWTYNKDAKEVQITNYNPNEQTLSPSKLFTNFYDKEYKYHFAGEKSFNGKMCNIVELTPVSGSKQFSKVQLMIDKTTSTIAGGSIWEKNGNKYQYEISNYTANPNIPDAFFTYDAKSHPGVEIVDLR
ncbi:MAG: outer membrane lipoprotein carrier protein LolA [Taibaiella sp.]|nr:outer membrane lipoprotein carrier protein LolA [Taibaiella sp.]